MDTDYLTEKAYHVIRLAADASDFLRSDIGVACSEYQNEDDYLKGILEFVKEIDENAKGYLDDWNILDQTDINLFKKRVIILRDYIKETLSIPISERGETEW